MRNRRDNQAPTSTEILSAAFTAAIPMVYQCPSAWAETAVSLSGCVSSRQDNVDWSLTPYAVDIINAWDFTGVHREITVIAPDQTAKTLQWLLGLLWTLTFKPSLNLIVYPIESIATKVNAEKFEPLVRSIPALSRQMDLPHTVKVDSYKFADSQTYFTIAANRIIAQSAKIRIADELDRWQEHEKQTSNLSDLRKRARSFNESLLYKCSTPVGEEEASQIWKEFSHSSQGYWYLRCQGCGKLTIRSCDLYNLKFKFKEQLKENSPTILDASTIRLACPACGHLHTEDQKRQMNIQGAYIHEFPELLDTLPGFQYGALASQWDTLSWAKIATEQIKSGSTAEYEAQLDFDNSWRGLPYRPRKRTSTKGISLREHCGDTPQASDIINVFMTADTQKEAYYHSIFAVDRKWNVHLLSYGTASTPAELLTVYHSKPLGIPIAMMMVDGGGDTRQLEVANLKEHVGIYEFQGLRLHNPSQGWAESKTIRKQINASAKYWQAYSLRQIYEQPDRSNHYLFFPHSVSDEYLTHLADMHCGKKANAAFVDWISASQDHSNHYYTCLKMMYCLLDFAQHRLPASSWRRPASAVAKAPDVESREPEQQMPKPQPKPIQMPLQPYRDPFRD